MVHISNWVLNTPIPSQSSTKALNIVIFFALGLHLSAVKKQLQFWSGWQTQQLTQMRTKIICHLCRTDLLQHIYGRGC